MCVCLFCLLFTVAWFVSFCLFCGSQNVVDWSCVVWCCLCFLVFVIRRSGKEGNRWMSSSDHALVAPAAASKQFGKWIAERCKRLKHVSRCFPLRFCQPKNFRTVGLKISSILRTAEQLFPINNSNAWFRMCPCSGYEQLDHDGLAIPAGGRVLGAHCWGHRRELDSLFRWKFATPIISFNQNMTLNFNLMVPLFRCIDITYMAPSS